MKFTLEIDLNDDTMGTYPQIEEAVTNSLQLYHDAISLGGVPVDEDEGILRDTTGKEVGKWKVGPSLHPSELATILAALRYYQQNGQGNPDNRSDDIHRIATDDDCQISLDDEGIDALCERINL